MRLDQVSSISDLEMQRVPYNDSMDADESTCLTPYCNVPHTKYEVCQYTPKPSRPGFKRPLRRNHEKIKRKVRKEKRKNGKRNNSRRH